MASGNLTLINTTPSDWTLSGQHSYQMDSWEFPDTISAYSMVSVPVDFAGGLNQQEDDAGDASYDIADGGSFSIAARNTDGFDISVTINGFSTKTNEDGSTLDLGYAEDQAVHWILAGQPDAYNSVNVAVDWMQQNLDTLGDRKLRYVCMPGSHDAGMSTIGTKTAFSTEANTRTQEWDIGTQLSTGSRWFDIRPVVSGGSLYTGHYSDLGDTLGWQGADGQSIDDVISNINDFTADNAELVILDISHAYDTDNDYNEFNQDQWNDLFDKLGDINNLYTNQNSSGSLLDNTMNDFIGGGNAAVILIAELNDGISIDTATYDYVYTIDGFGGIYNNYADTDDLDTMISDQLTKLSDNRALDAGNDGWFLLSWTLTQSVEQIIGGESSSILDMAASAYEPLFQQGFGGFTSNSFPNVLYVDLFGSGVSPDSDFPIFKEKGKATPQGDANRKAKMIANDRVPAHILDSKMTPGVDNPANDITALAMAVNGLAGTSDIVGGSGANASKVVRPRGTIPKRIQW